MINAKQYQRDIATLFSEAYVSAIQQGDFIKVNEIIAAQERLSTLPELLTLIETKSESNSCGEIFLEN